MRRSPKYLQFRKLATVVLALSVIGGLLSLAPGSSARFGTGLAIGQQRSAVSAELSAALSRAAPGERVPVVIELTRADPLHPIALERAPRAAEHASNLAGQYLASVERLRSGLGSDLSLDLLDAEVLWIGGAVAARLSPSQIRSLDGQPGIRQVYYDSLIRIDFAGPSAGREPLLWRPGFGGSAQDPAGGLPEGLRAIGAPEVWEAGATGEGAVVAIIDSGVDGDHPLLRRKWRGLSTSAQEAWFDPWGLSDRPVDDDLIGGIGHGTIVTTVAVGGLEPGDTLVEVGGSKRVVQGSLEAVTGVAPGAEWVAANAFQLFGGASYTRRSVLLQSLQWALDPDGDPFTVSDIPDVVNNSWGFPTSSCDGLFDRAIDALELVGVPVVFAAGNRSSGLDTVATPASRADLLLNAYSVGATQERDGEIVVAENSLGGPSPCAPGAVKPEVVAPGIVPLVRNAGPVTAGVGALSGPFTSWASPHVTGSLAVLSGLNPGAGANDLKDALFSTARDLPPAGLDNRSGAGFIDLVAAANRIGGLGGVNLDVVSWNWDLGGATLTVELFNGGVSAFPGGMAELRRSAGGEEALGQAIAPVVGARDRAAIVFAGLSADPTRERRLQVRLESDGAVLELPLSLTVASATAVRIEDGSVQFSLDASGRLGSVARSPGFAFLGRDWLTAGAFLVTAGDRVSDAAYVDVLGRSTLKSNPVGSDTDWSGRALETEASNVRLEYSDARALRPIGATVQQSALLSSIGDTAAFVLLAVTVAVDRTGEIPMMGLLLDWDFGRRERVFWSDDLAASVMTPLDSAGPWMALTTAPQAPTTHAAIPIGEPVLGFFDFGSGVLADTVCQESACSLAPFSDEAKARFLRLGGDRTSSVRISDWAQLVAVGPLGQSEMIAFVVAAGSTESALRAALDSARALADQLGSQLQPLASSPSEGLELLPAFPNPFDPTTGQIVKLPFLVSRGSGEVSALLEILTIAGRLVYSETRDISASAPLEPFRWDGRLSNGDVAATGVYGYVLQVGNEKRSGKLLLLK